MTHGSPLRVVTPKAPHAPPSRSWWADRQDRETFARAVAQETPRMRQSKEARAGAAYMQGIDRRDAW